MNKLSSMSTQGDRAEYVVEITALSGAILRLTYKVGAAAKRVKKAMLESLDIFEVHIYRYDYSTTNIGDFQLADRKEVF